MTAQELKSKLTEDDIKKLLELMGATFYYEDDDMWITDTICHHGTKPKLYFYKDSMSFHCYTECGQLDIIGVVMGYKGYEQEEFQKAINWISVKLNLDNHVYGFGKQEQISDWEFIKKYKKNKKVKPKDKILVPYDKNILNIFQHFYCQSWIEEGISVETMKKYNILYSTWQQKIIIPHYDMNNNLVGVRSRALLPDDIELFGKYAPFKIGNKFYNHSLGLNLFGLNHNINAIQKKRKIMLVEAEKSVFQTDTMFGEDNFTVALCGSNLTDYQKGMILMLGVREVIVALDKQYQTLDSDECKNWSQHIKDKIIDKLSPFISVSVLWDSTNLLGYKDSPTDGVYPKYKPEAIEQSAFYSKNALGETKELVSSFGLRNSQLLTIAPTGSLSTMLGVSGGIEPIFANYYTRKTESLKGHDEYYKVYTPIVKKYIDEHNLKDDSELPDYFVTAQTLDYKNRIYMQSIWQSHIDASISSTVNVPNDFTIEQVESLYMSAWESGLKGVTIFRDGCKRSGILTTTSSVSDINDDKEKKTLPRGYIVVADDNVIGLKRKVMSGCGSLHIVAMFDPITGELLETYISKGSTGGCQSNLAAVSRLISLSARAGVDVYTIADQLKSCPACPSYVGRTMTKHDTSKGKCCPDAIANALIDMYKEMKNSIFSDDIETSNVKSKVIKKNTEDKEQSVNVKNPCPVCGEELTFEGGCNVCKACGWSKCD